MNQSARVCTVVGCGLTARNVWMQMACAIFICKVVFEHDAPLWNSKVVSLALLVICTCMRKATGVVRTAHEEKRVHGIFLGLLARHA